MTCASAVGSPPNRRDGAPGPSWRASRLGQAVGGAGVAWLLIVQLASSCSPRPGVILSPGGPVVTPEYIDSVGRKVSGDWKDAPRRYASDKATLLAESVDTLEVRPD